jgi:hypothetical protein
MFTQTTVRLSKEGGSPHCLPSVNCVTCPECVSGPGLDNCDVPSTVDVIAWLNPPLWLDEGVAGMSYPIKLASARVRLTLPLDNASEAIHSSDGRLPPAPKFPGKRTPASLRVPLGVGGYALPVPDSMLLASAVWLRIPAEGEFGSATNWPVMRLSALPGLGRGLTRGRELSASQ